jgi:hypothetical protein
MDGLAWAYWLSIPLSITAGILTDTKELLLIPIVLAAIGIGWVLLKPRS